MAQAQILGNPAGRFANDGKRMKNGVAHRLVGDQFLLRERPAKIRDVVGGGEDIFQAIQITRHRG